MPRRRDLYYSSRRFVVCPRAAKQMSDDWQAWLRAHSAPLAPRHPPLHPSITVPCIWSELKMYAWPALLDPSLLAG